MSAARASQIMAQSFPWFKLELRTGLSSFAVIGHSFLVLMDPFIRGIGYPPMIKEINQF